MAKSRKCEYPACGQFFTPARSNQIYHSDKCRIAHYAILYYGKTEVFKVCPNCGTDFPTSKPLRQTFCTPECRTDAHVKQSFHQPLPFIDEGLASMEEYIRDHPTTEKAKATALGGYYCYLPEHTAPQAVQSPDGGCDLCGKNSRHTEPHKGLQLCGPCLSFATYVDNSMVEHYQELLEKTQTPS